MASRRFTRFSGSTAAPCDLNTRIPADSGLQLVYARAINDRGEIAGIGVLPNGDLRAILLIPCDQQHAIMEGYKNPPEGTTTVTPYH